MNPPNRSRRKMSRAHRTAPSEARSPFRLWMTGSLAVVMAALIPMRELADDAAGGSGPASMRLIGHSRFGVAETLQRIEAAAAGQGLQVLARIGGVRAAIVLASSVGGTLVVMQEADSRPAIPLGLLVRADGSGGADVLGSFGEPADRQAWRELPEAVLRDIAGLPRLVERALG